MKRLSMISIGAGTMGLLFSVSVYAASPGASSNGKTDPDPALVAQLESAANQDLADGRNGNKNNPHFQWKAMEVHQLIDRLKAGENVNPAEIDKALEPVQVW